MHCKLKYDAGVEARPSHMTACCGREKDVDRQWVVNFSCVVVVEG